MSSEPSVSSESPNDTLRGKSRKYVPALGPRMHSVLWLIFLLTAVLGSTGFYLIAVRAYEIYRGQSYQSQFSLWMFLAHILVGVAVLIPFVPFGIAHWRSSSNRTNRRAIRWGIVLFAIGLLVGLTGLALVQLEGMPQLSTGSLGRGVAYWLHIATPILAVVVYVVHRKAGPKLRWKWGGFWGGATIAFTAVMLAMHSHDPRQWHARGSPEGEKYFEPSAARTVNGKFISASTLMNDEYCLQCHADIYKSHIHSAHRNSSFNNPAYRFSVRETRQRAGVRAARWCAGCHDPVPFFSGEFDDPNYDDVNHPTASAGVTCTVCHAISHVGSRSGNGDYTIDEPIHYPFATSDNPTLKWISQQMVKAKPEFHKQTFLKPFHRSEEFCSTCHKVGLPQEVNRYKEFLRGQNHSDSFWLSGVSAWGTQFLLPGPSKDQCADCHMPLQPSSDFGACDFDGSGTGESA
ncbi:MAG: multiheme c-type cytochrome [Gemmataceae bacterium]